MSLGSVDDDDVISAMLESSHGQGSLAGVIAPVTSPDIFASFSSHGSFHGHDGGGLARASSMSQAGLSSNRQQQQHEHSSSGRGSNERWSAGDEKWMLDAKGEVLALHMTSNNSSGSAFDADFDTLMPPMMSSGGGGGGLHRYHSAPSSFLQALADDAFTQIPAMGGSSTMSAMFSEGGGLAPITEQMDVERSGSGGTTTMTEFEHFLAPESDFSRRAALSALGKPENSETFANLFPPGKSSGLVRQKSLPVAAQNGPLRQDIATEEHHSEESLSGTSEDNGLKVSIYDDLFSRDTLTSWPTSPGTPGGGKRARGSFPSDQSDPSSVSADTAKAFQLRNMPPQVGLIRHASLPTPAPSLTADDHFVQMRARAKRGCATHPRSIAERVRRTRISERMKKLQDLVPNMEKTTNTSDMLDETVEYVKSLQSKVRELNDTIAKLKAAESP